MFKNLKNFVFVLITTICSSYCSQPTTSVDIIFLSKDKYKVSLFDASCEKKDTFEDIETFYKNLRIATNNLLDIDNVCLNYANNSELIFNGIRSNNNRFFNLFLRGSQDFRPSIYFNCGNNALNVSNIYGGNISSFRIKSNLSLEMSNIFCHNQCMGEIIDNPIMKVKPNTVIEIDETYQFFKFSLRTIQN